MARLQRSQRTTRPIRCGAPIVSGLTATRVSSPTPMAEASRSRRRPALRGLSGRVRFHADHHDARASARHASAISNFIRPASARVARAINSEKDASALIESLARIAPGQTTARGQTHSHHRSFRRRRGLMAAFVHDEHEAERNIRRGWRRVDNAGKLGARRIVPPGRRARRSR